jgi:hypothetical protein
MITPSAPASQANLVASSSSPGNAELYRVVQPRLVVFSVEVAPRHDVHEDITKTGVLGFPLGCTPHRQHHL